jgi:signal transduction histidine kinase
MGQPGKPQFAMLLVALPLLVAASAGRGIASVITSTSASLGGDDDDGVLHLSASQLLGAALIGCALAGLVPVYATLLVRGQPHAWWVATIWQVLTLIAWAVATPFLFRFWRRVRAVNASGVSAEELVMHAGILLCIGAQHAIVIILVTRLLFIPLGPMPTVQSTAWAFAAYLPIDALTYCLIVSLSHAYDAGRQLRAATAREAAVRGELATTRLSSLQAQLRPHFLFNALNAATVLARRGDAERSGDVLARLSDLLRYVLRGAGAPETPGYVRLDEELAFADAYLAIERERFADRLHPVIDADDDARNALVPHLVLQPLVENAIHHGVDARIAAGHVRVAAQRDDDRLILTVDDDGPGPGDVEPKGIGLANTTSRLATLYGDKASVNLSQRKEGGTRATIVIPYVA